MRIAPTVRVFFTPNARGSRSGKYIRATDPVPQLRQERHICRNKTKNNSSPSGATYSDNYSPSILILPAFNGKYDMDVDLRVGVGHGRKMPLLTELKIFFPDEFYRDVAPTGLA